MSTDMSKYLGLFETEAKEYLQTLNTSLVNIEKTPNDQDLLFTLMRLSHTLKGMAGTMGFTEMMALCHKMEDFFDAAKKNSMQLTKDINNILFECLDALNENVKQVAQSKPELKTADLVAKLDQKFKGENEKPIENKTENKEEKDHTKADAVYEKTETKYKMEEIKDIKVDVEKLDALMNLTEELIVMKMRLNEIDKKGQYQFLKAELDQLNRLAEELQHNVTKTRMIEVGYLFNRFPRMIRDLAQKENKEIDLEIEGAEMELDRSIISELDEPLIHLLRNAIDHGIEKKGKIKLTAKRDKNLAIIEVEDTGGGIDVEKVKEAALKAKLINLEQASKMTEPQLIDLIFSGEVSTSETVTDVSGRGVGMAVVKNKISSLNGNIVITTKKGEGTKFSLELPLTLAIIKGLLVKCGDETYAIPLSFIERNVDLDRSHIKKAADNQVAIIDEEDIPLINLNDKFKLNSLQKDENKKTIVVIVQRGDEKIGLIVDDIISEEDIVVKPLSQTLRHIKEFAGVTVLGNGKTILILDVAHL